MLVTLVPKVYKDHAVIVVVARRMFNKLSLKSLDSEDQGLHSVSRFKNCFTRFLIYYCVFHRERRIKTVLLADAWILRGLPSLLCGLTRQVVAHNDNETHYIAQCTRITHTSNSSLRCWEAWKAVYGQNATVQNATRKIDSRTKCHPRNERPDKMPLARALHFCKLVPSRPTYQTRKPS